MTSVTERDLLTTGESARLLGTSRQHVVDLCRRGLLPFETVGTHRRLRRQDVEDLGRRPPTRDQARSLWLHRAVAGRVAIAPDETLAKARANVEFLRTVHPDGMAARWLDEWATLLDRGPFAVLETLTAGTERAIDLRQNTPFAGVLSEGERSRALAAFRDHWRQLHPR